MSIFRYKRLHGHWYSHQYGSTTILTSILTLSNAFIKKTKLKSSTWVIWGLLVFPRQVGIELSGISGIFRCDHSCNLEAWSILWSQMKEWLSGGGRECRDYWRPQNPNDSPVKISPSRYRSPLYIVYSVHRFRALINDSWTHISMKGAAKLSTTLLSSWTLVMSNNHGERTTDHKEMSYSLFLWSTWGPSSALRNILESLKPRILHRAVFNTASTPTNPHCTAKTTNKNSHKSNIKALNPWCWDNGASLSPFPQSPSRLQPTSRSPEPYARKSSVQLGVNN